MEIRHTSCCGLQEIVGITETHNVEHILDVVGDDRYNDQESNGAFYVFTDTGTGTHGKRLSEYIHKNKLGTVTRGKAKRNPNTGNMLILFTWALNGPAFRSWYRKRHPNENTYY